MKTSVIEVGDLLTASSPDELGKRIGEIPGVESVSVDHAAESATVRYDETRIEVAGIKSWVQRSGRIVAAPPAASASTSSRSAARTCRSMRSRSGRRASTQAPT
ncbi:hypothetical protein GTW51_22065 [Aurantimonas aggregata]|uniref:HMA domain-containing protein n=1 Tax=Aurantimonas aggregata TaxID=2047720 RepID=A0A6L9MNQ2_9HYPH|nr:hypothetical protein [Aurantimonas aggregata]